MADALNINDEKMNKKTKGRIGLCMVAAAVILLTAAWLFYMGFSTGFTAGKEAALKGTDCGQALMCCLKCSGRVA